MTTPNPPAPRHGSGTPLLNGHLITGALVGGAVTYILTNEAVQRAAISGAARLWLAVKGGLEETKERFRDAEHEIRTEQSK